MVGGISLDITLIISFLRVVLVCLGFGGSEISRLILTWWTGGDATAKMNWRSTEKILRNMHMGRQIAHILTRRTRRVNANGWGLSYVRLLTCT
jgi:hypothetical protein